MLLDLQAVLVTLALITPRAVVCLSMMPGFSMRTLTGMMRNGVAIAIALPAALPTFEYVQNTPPDYLFSGLLMMKEAAIGLLLGIVVSIPVWVAQSIGSILDAQRSPIQIPSNNASVDKDASALGALLLQAVVLVMIQSGLFIGLTRVVIDSYGVWPAFTLTPPFEPAHLEVLIKQFSEFFWHIVVYGGPVIIPLLLVDFAFAMIGVFASNLQVSFASSPIKSLAGMFILLVYWPIFSHYVTADFSHMLDFSATLLDAGSRH
ncbi:type III secretion system export apparatus subunit SctT [Collimonas humicola]|uniref:type III secretion system export apparatus subunit SctT n=1 Tax=Collimonas humicola TaxID=2825886 RepID=UPI001E60CD24|nr:type III secretion system export apparatus subunit SctT [Collimonas humicola]